mmetsp:Transcript_35572/g.93011  ORF Transcript_35572/g.93011 Transcript_35572/m.93011 type:complete len:200 (-) Transcript_35572:140-739(-)
MCRLVPSATKTQGVPPVFSYIAIAQSTTGLPSASEMSARRWRSSVARDVRETRSWRHPRSMPPCTSAVGTSRLMASDIAESTRRTQSDRAGASPSSCTKSQVLNSSPISKSRCVRPESPRRTRIEFTATETCWISRKAIRWTNASAPSGPTVSAYSAFVDSTTNADTTPVAAVNMTQSMPPTDRSPSSKCSRSRSNFRV